MQQQLTLSLRRLISEDGRALVVLARLTGVDIAVLSRFMRGERSMTLTTADRIVDKLGHVATFKKRGGRSDDRPRPRRSA